MKSTKQSIRYIFLALASTTTLMLTNSFTEAFSVPSIQTNIRHTTQQQQSLTNFNFQKINSIETCNPQNQRKRNFVNSNRNSARSRSKLNMAMPVAASGAASVMGVVSGGILGGALHAIAGPDHLAALLPKCVGQRWYRAGQIGAVWGMGHGISALILGLTAFGLKNRLSSMPLMKGLLVGVSSAMEIAVGLSLILIGLLGVKEAREWEEEIEASSQSLSAAAAEAGVKRSQKRAVVLNGILHGFSWDGAPSLAPAVAVATWRGSISFLLAYGLGTMAAMCITTTLIGEGTRRAGELFNRPDIPQKLSLVSSLLAMGVGVFWCYLAFK